MAHYLKPHFTMKRRRSPAKSQQSTAKSHIRLIAGQWRGRKLSFPTIDGLRPTPDRVRETLFNWLANEMPQANCLDLFAGSAALGLECLSRGASSTTFIEANKEAVTAINENLALLQGQGKVIQGFLPTALQQLALQKFDVIFIDPPYAQAQLISECLHQLIQQQAINDNAWVYIENASQDALPALPENVEIFRQKNTGQVQSTLLRFHLTS